MTLTQKKYDVAILDIMVPFVSGLEVLEVITQTQPQCATIMLTALGDESNQLKAFNRLADDYIIKPFSPLVLLKRIEAVLRRTRNKPELTNGLEVRQENYGGESDRYQTSNFNTITCINVNCCKNYICLFIKKRVFFE